MIYKLYVNGLKVKNNLTKKEAEFIKNFLRRENFKGKQLYNQIKTISIKDLSGNETTFLWKNKPAPIEKIEEFIDYNNL